MILSQRWSLMAFVGNATDVCHWTFAQPDGDSVLRYAAPPRTYGLTITYEY